LEEGRDTKLIFLMVNKKVKTKLINALTTGNPQPGTVLDRFVTQVDEEDFYIVCAESRQGVPTPTHFTILENTFGPELTLKEI
jgi:hypothetical protein